MPYMNRVQGAGRVPRTGLYHVSTLYALFLLGATALTKPL